jgi:hypothetical protein
MINPATKMQAIGVGAVVSRRQRIYILRQSEECLFLRHAI